MPYPIRVLLSALFVAALPCVAQQDIAAKPITELQRYAGRGDAEAQSQLGWVYFTGEGAAQDYPQAAVWYRKAADQGNAEAQYMLGEMYSVPLGVAKDDAAALDWYVKAGEQGHEKAQLHLGWMYTSGKGVALDAVKGTAWYRRAADAGSIEGKIQLGRSYMMGRGVTLDNAEALKLFQYGADRANPDCEMMMAWMLYKGVGTEKDLVGAYMWCTLALTGSEGAVNFIEVIRKEMTPEQIAEGEKRAAEWKPVEDVAKS